MIYILSRDDQGHFYLKVEAEKHPEILNTGIKRVQLWFETGQKAHLALKKPKTMTEPVVYLSQTLCRKLGFKEGDEFLAKIIPDHTPYQFDMP
jgi:hypothetical protein